LVINETASVAEQGGIMQARGGVSCVYNLEVIVDQDATPVDWDDVLAAFLLRYVRRSAAPAGASTAERFTNREARKVCNECFSTSV
jgi:hypothetical protein